MNMTRIPMGSARPIAWFGALRVAIVLATIVALVGFDIPGRGKLLVLAAAVALPLSIAVLVLARRAPEIAPNPVIALVDLGLLAVAEAVAPETYAGVRFLALLLIAAHAHFQGEVRGVAIAAAGVILLVPIGATTDGPVSGTLLAFYEFVFAVSALATGLFMGRLRTVESTGRLRARELSRRAIEAESRVRRRIAEAIHDGPVQELVSLDMMLDTARRALERGDADRATNLIEEARAMAERNIGTLREEIVSLGPYAFDELTLDVALEQCAPVWSRRYAMPIRLDLEDVDLTNETCGSLFGIAQEAVANAGRHAEASEVAVSVRSTDGHVELRVIDDGRGFDEQAALESDEPGHIGLVTMRERAELAGGTLLIDSGKRGTTVLARVPLGPLDEVETPGAG
jgi:two-component system, NarL family, sensor kinase